MDLIDCKNICIDLKNLDTPMETAAALARRELGRRAANIQDIPNTDAQALAAQREVLLPVLCFEIFFLRGTASAALGAVWTANFDCLSQAVLSPMLSSCSKRSHLGRKSSVRSQQERGTVDGVN